MAFREFEGEEHASLYRKYRERPPESLISRIISYVKDEYDGPLSQAVDLGCGSGQCSFLLAPHFTTVLATDISSAQIKEAEGERLRRSLDNVTFQISPAEKIPLPSQSVQLVTACTAAHWFNLNEVYEEGKRVLVPGGVMAFLCTQDRILEFGENEEININLKTIMDDLNFNILKPFYAPPVELWYNRYRDIVIPFRNLVREFDHGKEVAVAVSLEYVLGVLASQSAFQTFRQQKGEDEGDKLLSGVKRRVLEVTGLTEEDVEKSVLQIRLPYMLVMARV